jgi:stage IV sporulation protein A
VVTTDGTITDIPRSDYITAEGRAIRDMKATGKPFLVIINSRNPGGDAAAAVKAQLKSEFGVDAAVADCQALDSSGIAQLLKDLLYAFPMQELRVYLPRWMDALEPEHPVKAALYEALLRRAGEISTLGQAEPTLSALKDLEQVLDFSIRNVDLATGTVSCALGFPESLFYEILSANAGIDIRSDAQLISLLADLAKVKQEYDKISDALSSVKATGYGVVMPTAEEMKLENPEILRKGGSFGIKLKAGAPSIHMIRVDIDTEINPMVGDEKQSLDLIDRLSNEAPEKLWQSNIFGKSVYELIQEGLTTKLVRTPEDVRAKFRGSLTRIVNEGASGLICLIL